MEANKMKEELSELKTGQELLKYRADQTDKVIAKLEATLEKLTKGGYIFLGIYVAAQLGAGDAIKILLKGLM